MAETYTTCSGLAAPSKGEEGTYGAGWCICKSVGLLNNCCIEFPQLGSHFLSFGPASHVPAKTTPVFILQTIRTSYNWDECFTGQAFICSLPLTDIPAGGWEKQLPEAWCGDFQAGPEGSSIAHWLLSFLRSAPPTSQWHLSAVPNMAIEIQTPSVVLTQRCPAILDLPLQGEGLHNAQISI